MNLKNNSILKNKEVKKGGLKLLKGCFDMVVARIKDNNIEKAIRIYDEICKRTKDKYYRKELSLKSAKILEVVEKYEENMNKNEGDLEKTIVDLAEKINLEWENED